MARAGIYLLGDLSAVLLVLEGALGGDEGLDELTFGRVVELEVGALDADAVVTKRVAKIEEGARVAAGPLVVVNDKDEVAFRLCINKQMSATMSGR
ncbi:MAG: hypothetical protein AAF565_21845 [Pseudomonadota bacterium]